MYSSPSCFSNLYIIYNIITGVPEMVSNVTVDDNLIKINENIVTIKLIWEEPFNNLDPILYYTVTMSCSGDDWCSLTFNITGNSVIITNLTTMTTYTFSVVATNSIGSGEAGVLNYTTPTGEGTDT